MKIVTVPDKVLTQKAKPVASFGPKLHKTVQDMKKTLLACVDPIGVGLAAPQVGLSLRIFIMLPTRESTPQVFVNPVILKLDHTHKPSKKQSENQESFEGCLSIPRIWGPVRRPQKLTLQWADIAGETHVADFTGFEAVIIQHEIDHLNGVLFTHHCTTQHAPLYEEKEGKFHEIKL